MFQSKKYQNNLQSETLIQPALEIGAEDDEHEKEANAVADKVMRMSDGSEGRIQRMCVGCEEEEEKKNRMSDGNEGKIQRMCTGCEEEEEKNKMSSGMEGKMQRMADPNEGKIQMMVAPPLKIQKMSAGPGAGLKASHNVEQGIQQSKGGGQNLSPDVQQDLGSKMNADFSGVKVHTDENAVQMNKEVGAKAFTHGNDIYFNQGQYNPTSQSGKHLLAHELTHTVQQHKSVKRKIQRQPIPQEDWTDDRDENNRLLYYTSEQNAKERLKDIQSKGEWEQLQIVSFIHEGKTRYKVQMRGRRTINNFIVALRKAEAAYPNWDKETMVNSLRELGGYDTEKFQKMYGTQPATKLAPVPGKLTVEDIALLKSMLEHSGNDDKEKGVLKDNTGEYVAMGHVMTGISGGLHRNLKTDIGGFAGFGEYMDNLFATTLSGDLGQSAVLVNEGKQTEYVGEGTEATDAELVGDIDGLIMGLYIDTLETMWNDSEHLSDFIENYYNNIASKRFTIVKDTVGDSNLLDQIKRFATNYSYRSSYWSGGFSEIATESKAAFDAYKTWLDDKISASTGPITEVSDVCTIKANNVLLVYDPSVYQTSVITKLMTTDEIRVIDKGEKGSFNQVEDKYKWTKVIVLNGPREGSVGWVSNLFLEKKTK